MFGKILSIKENVVKVENSTNTIQSNVINLHLIFEFGSSKLVGEIIESTNESFLVNLIGEINNGKFLMGTVLKPPIDSTIRIVYKNEVELLLGPQTYENMDALYLGKSVIYSGFNVAVNLNEFFSNHFAIIGNTGSGKSCGVARILQNMFTQDVKNVPINANIVLFDIYGEYHNAFNKIGDINGVNYKSLTTKLKFAEGDIINIPAYFLDIDDLALLLQADDPAQIPILQKALNLVYLFVEEEEKVIEYKNDIIAKALLDILASGRTPTQIRDQIIAVLTRFNTKDLNLESKISQPGYVRTIKQCLNIDQTGKINTINLVVDLLEDYSKENLEFESSGEPFTYTLKDLHHALEFALISEGALKSDVAYDKGNQLKVRLNAIINSEFSKYFEVDEYIDKIAYVKKIFTSANGEKAQIVNINMNYVEERFAKALTKIYSKLFFDFALRQENRGGFPIQILVEEAHRYVRNDNDITVLGYNIFDRITKEGRKYGVVLGLITQRPIELSSISLSQCSNFIAFRLYHPDDLNIVGGISTSVSKQTIHILKTLQPGTALAFGTAFKIPSLVRLDYPNPAPSSINSDISKVWYNKTIK